RHCLDKHACLCRDLQSMFFFFQAEDGIRDFHVTGVQTCALPIYRAGMASGIDMSARMVSLSVNIALMGFILASGVLAHLKAVLRSEERRVGKERRTRGPQLAQGISRIGTCNDVT